MGVTSIMKQVKKFSFDAQELKEESIKFTHRLCDAEIEDIGAIYSKSSDYANVLEVPSGRYTKKDKYSPSCSVFICETISGRYDINMVIS